MKKRADFDSNPDDYFASQSGRVAHLVQELRSLIQEAAPRAKETIKWGMPVYEGHGLICAIRPSKEYVALQFYSSGTNLEDPDGLLEGTGKKMRHVKIRSKRDIRKKLFTSWIKQAARHVQ